MNILHKFSIKLRTTNPKKGTPKRRPDTPSHLRLTRLGVSTVAALLALIPLSGRTGELQLADSPLFLANSVQPNIFFMADDSGSMDWEVLLNAGAIGANSGDLNLTPATNEERSEFCVGYNVLAYDPNVRYTPWIGKDNASPAAPFQDAELMEALGFAEIRRNPYCPKTDTTSSDCNDATNNGVVNLTDPAALTIAYFPWNDADSDGDFDAGECGDVTSFTAAVTWAELPTHDPDGDAQPGTPTVPGAEQQTNYANWFSYYRKREYVVKRAASGLLADSQRRVGMSSLHNNQNIGTPIQDMDDITLPVNPVAQANKDALLRNLSRIRSTGGTPLRVGLENVGQYYEGSASAGWQTALFNGPPNHDISETVSTLSPIFNADNGGSCQQNFTVLLSDGFWNGVDDPSVGNTDIEGPGPFDGDPYEDNVSNTLADVAMHYYERDLRSDLNNNVPVISSVDNNTAQHMNTYTVAFGLQGTLPESVTANCPTTGAFSWPTPIADDPTTLDDMFHAACNGRGLYLNAAKPGQLTQRLQDAIDRIDDQIGTAASVATTSGTLTANSRVFQARFRSGEWSGDLFSVQLDLANEQLGARDWSAGDILKTMDPTTDRVILTTKADTRTGVAFDWGELSTGVGSQQEMLDADPDTGNPDGLGPQRVSFLRGDHSDEIDATAGTGIFRTRDDGFVLGDIVNSGPVFVGAPPFLYPDDLENPTALTRRYSQFRGNNNNRTPVVYVGANDGMFHGFNADTGREVLAYVPTSVYPKLNQLTDSGYSHRYYVDGSPTYGDAFFSGDWQSVIVGTLAGGGQGVFALDVTNPSSFSELNAGQTVLWEFTDDDDPDLGFTYGPAVIAKTHDGGKWAVFLGNGYNNTQADGNASTTGNAVLYVLFIEDGTDGTWTLNSDYIKIDTGKGMATSADLSTPNGLASPAVIDADGDFIADFVFAGDLQGNMWKFDVRNSDSSTWDLAPGSVPLFTATDDSSGQPQPITVQPEVLNHPTGEGGFMVYFGTGKYIENADNVVAGGAQTQTFYGIWDQLGTDPSSHSTVDKNKLRTQALTTDTAGGQTVRVFDNPQPITAWGTGAGEHMGWRVHLPELGERNITNPAVIADRMLFTTLIPLESPCDFGGTGFLMELSIVDGGPPPESVFDITDDDFFDTNDLSDRGLVVVGVNPDIGILPQPAVLAGGGSGAGGGGGGGECFYAKIEAGTKDVDAGAVIKNKCPDTPLANRRSWRQLR